MFTTALMISVLIYNWYDLRNLRMIKLICCQLDVNRKRMKITAWYFFKEEQILPLLDNKTVVENLLE